MATLWTERHQPSTEAELVVQKKKIAEVREFLTSGTAAGKRILILRGPAGCGKAAVLRCMCRDIGFDVVEWSVAVRGATRGQEGYLEGAGSMVGRESISQLFLRFVAQGDRYGSLHGDIASLAGGSMPFPPVLRPRVTLVRDFPFTLLRGSGNGTGSPDFLRQFHEMVQSGTVHRAVFCFNDTSEDYFAVQKLFGPIDSYVMSTVSFDGVPRTFAQKALDMVAKAEGLDSSAANIAAIAAECGGDLRHALNALQLAAVCARSRCLPKSAKANSQGRRGRGRTGGSITMPPPPTPQGGASECGASITIPTVEATPGTQDASWDAEKALRSATLGFFHSLGRLLWCKRIPPEGFLEMSSASKRRKRATEEPKQLPRELLTPKSSRPPLYFVPEEVLGSANAEATTMVDWLFTNAPRYYGNVDDLAEFASSLAETDAWGAHDWHGGDGSNNAPLEALASSVQVRSLLDANLQPVPPSFTDSSTTQEGLAFNMIRPLMRDVARHRTRRREEIAGHMEATGPHALGAVGPSPALFLRTLPFVHLMLKNSRGNHPTLRFLPHAMMHSIKDLIELTDVGFSSSSGGNAGVGRVRADEEAQALQAWSISLPDDPIELDG
mmetsp:Transcript_124176/g.247421  ORF Transcript_124176/g.247421 Transcript_124176/m.247421 type:complete len:611 (+) Transcript_124176:45-1877(+)